MRTPKRTCSTIPTVLVPLVSRRFSRWSCLPRGSSARILNGRSNTTDRFRTATQEASPSHGHHRVRPREDRRADRKGGSDPRAQARRERRLPQRSPSGTLPAAWPPAGRTRPRTPSTSTADRAAVCSISTTTSTSTFTSAMARWWSGTRIPRSSRRFSAGDKGHPLRAADARPRRDRGEPLGSVQAAAVALRQLRHRDHARGHPPCAGEHRPRHDREDGGDLSRAPRLHHVQRRPRPQPRSVRASTR